MNPAAPLHVEVGRGLRALPVLAHVLVAAQFRVLTEHAHHFMSRAALVERRDEGLNDRGRAVETAAIIRSYGLADEFSPAAVDDAWAALGLA